MNRRGEIHCKVPSVINWSTVDCSMTIQVAETLNKSSETPQWMICKFHPGATSSSWTSPRPKDEWSNVGNRHQQLPVGVGKENTNKHWGFWGLWHGIYHINGKNSKRGLVGERGVGASKWTSLEVWGGDVFREICKNRGFAGKMIYIDWQTWGFPDPCRISGGYRWCSLFAILDFHWSNTSILNSGFYIGVAM